MRKILLFGLILLSSISFANNRIIDNVEIDGSIWLWLAVFLFLSRGLSFVEKIGLPLITAEILTGMLLSNLRYFGFEFFDNQSNIILFKFLGELGALILMFEIGLESSIEDIKSNLWEGSKIAISGKLICFAVIYFAMTMLSNEYSIYMCLLTSLVVSSTGTGVPVKVFKEMNINKSKEVKVVITASLIDEVISVILFAIISGIIINKSISIYTLINPVISVFGFLVVGIFIGRKLIPRITLFSSKIHAGINMKLGILLMLCFAFAWFAVQLHLAAVIGAFIAGLIIDYRLFRSFSRTRFTKKLIHIRNKTTDHHANREISKILNYQEERALEELIKPLFHFFVPMFFINIGYLFDIKVLFTLKAIILITIITCFSITARMYSAKVTKLNLNKNVVGLSMMPIGEAGLIFALFGSNIGVFNKETISTLVASMVLVTLVTPYLIKRQIKQKELTYAVPHH